LPQSKTWRTFRDAAFQRSLWGISKRHRRETASRRNREALDRVGNLTELRSRGVSTSEKIGILVTGRAIVRSYSSAIADFR
jgi:hypothetical protein